MRADLVNNPLGEVVSREGRKPRLVPSEGEKLTDHGAANAALECGGSRHRFPSVPNTENGQERKQTAASLFVMVEQMNDCGKSIEKRRRLPPHSKALRAALGAIRLEIAQSGTSQIPYFLA